MRGRSFSKLMSSCLQNPVIHSEIVGNVISPTTSITVSLCNMNHTAGMAIVLAADLIPCWTLMVLHEWRQSKGFI